MCKVSVLMGSISDMPVMEEASKILKEFGVQNETKILSAHRTPGPLRRYVQNAEKNGVGVFIVGAGGAAHLAGAVAALSPRPVIGVPLSSTSLNGLDALLSTVQMPKGVPVATVAIGKAGAVNAALLAVQIFALSHPEFAHKYKTYKIKMEKEVLSRNRMSS
ncbi:MAG: 5-(carboxyamino)imidazole ribonucleotide mutase [Chlamydiota bacterium]|nr:5-(carboxyamino)imidazole ribonucleotide mutase [Chlamydiota bacterium]